jgi:hypothetical protein
MMKKIVSLVFALVYASTVSCADGANSTNITTLPEQEQQALVEKGQEYIKTLVANGATQEEIQEKIAKMQDELENTGTATGLTDSSLDNEKILLVLIGATLGAATVVGINWIRAWRAKSKKPQSEIEIVERPVQQIETTIRQVEQPVR